MPDGATARPSISCFAGADQLHHVGERHVAGVAVADWVLANALGFDWRETVGNRHHALDLLFVNIAAADAAARRALFVVSVSVVHDCETTPLLAARG
jgi:hypothetical protein